MAVAPTGAIYKSLIFDGEDSRDYGVYITGEAVFNAPAREVEMIAIPGRNGSFALDKGRFENIEVKYPAGIFADTETDFAAAISEFRNLLCSRNGYVRLQDEYHPNEYRMAIYKSGLEVEPAQLKAGEFDIVFDCKPQRYLTSGETAISVDSGDTVTNPTLFESGPLLEVVGYGDITVGDGGIVVENVPIGDVLICDEQTSKDVVLGKDVHIVQYFKNLNALNTGDVITCERFSFGLTIRPSDSAYTSVVIGAVSGCTASARLEGRGSISLGVSIPNVSFEYGSTSDQFNASIQMTTTKDGSSPVTRTITILLGPIMGANPKARGYIELSAEGESGLVFSKITSTPYYGYSTKSALGDPLYIDLDIGDAYKVENGEVISINHAVSLPSKLPTLAVGDTEITYDNTITDLKVVPRWWKV